LLDLRNEILPVEPFVHDEIKVRVLGDIAVVTSRIKIKLAPTWNGLTNIYVKRQSRWRCIASHSSLRASSPSATDAPSGDGQPATDLRRTMAGINLQLWREGMFSRSAEVTDHGIRIRPRLKCIVESVHVKAGQTVKKGTPLVDLCSSVDLAEAKNDYLTREVQSKHDQRILDVRRKLFATNAIAEQVFADAQNAAEKSKLAAQVARGKLKFLGLNDEAIGLVEKEDGEQKSRLTLRAPVDGTVTEVDAEAGKLYDMMSVLMILNPKPSGPATRP
jgi:acetyl/propionyl-CoA carboxylase alpha subunit